MFTLSGIMKQYNCSKNTTLFDMSYYKFTRNRVLPLHPQKHKKGIYKPV